MFRALLYGLIPLVLASTDPQISTPSATATIPSWSVSSDVDAPTSPILLRPPDGSVTNNMAPEFVWQTSADIGSNTVFYTLYLNNSATYLGISNLGNSSSDTFSSRIESGEVRLIPTLALPDGTYSWYVTASDLSGNSSRSATWNLTIDSRPPPLTLTQLDHISYPPLSTGSFFELYGPKAVYFTFLSDPFTHIQLNISGPSSFQLVGLTLSTGYLTITQDLPLGIYVVTALAYDTAGNTVLLPDFSLELTQASIPIPGASALPIPPIIYNFPSALTHLPATLYQISASSTSALLYVILLALIIIILLFILSKRRHNLILLNSRLQPISRATLYHSHSSKFGFLQLSPSQQGHLYVPHLTRYSSLTVRVIDSDVCTTHILSISASSHHYTVVL